VENDSFLFHLIRKKQEMQAQKMPTPELQWDRHKRFQRRRRGLWEEAAVLNDSTAILRTSGKT